MTGAGEETKASPRFHARDIERAIAFVYADSQPVLPVGWRRTLSEGPRFIRYLCERKDGDSVTQPIYLDASEKGIEFGIGYRAANHFDKEMLVGAVAVHLVAEAESLAINTWLLTRCEPVHVASVVP